MLTVAVEVHHVTRMKGPRSIGVLPAPCAINKCSEKRDVRVISMSLNIKVYVPGDTMTWTSRGRRERVARWKLHADY